MFWEAGEEDLAKFSVFKVLFQFRLLLISSDSAGGTQGLGDLESHK